MATTGLLNQFNAVENVTSLLDAITMSLCFTAQAIATEATSTTNHANRVALARAVANNPQSFAQSFAFMLGAQGIDQTSPDTDINNMVSAVWNCMAGAP